MSKLLTTIRKATPNPVKRKRARGIRQTSLHPDGSSTTAQLNPSPGEKPEFLLRVQVIGCSDLLGKDKNGKSDPFVVVSLSQDRQSTPVVKKNLNPVFPPEKSTFDFPIYRSTIGVLGALQFVIWDKDLLKKDYLGEVALPFDEWFKNHNSPSPAFAFDDPRNTEFAASIISSRKSVNACGVIQLKLGLVPAEPNVVPDYTAIYMELQHLAKMTGLTLHASVPTRGIGTTAEGESDLEDDGLSSENDYSGDELDDGPNNGYGRSSQPPSRPVSRKNSQAQDAGPIPSPAPVLAAPTPSKSSTGSGLLPRVFTPRPSVSHKDSYGFEAGASSDNSRPASRTGIKRPSFRKGFDSSYNFASTNNDIVGIVMIDIEGAEDLPKLKNITKTGWDMDPFTVISFGKKVFRTRVVRHSLNPTWNEKLLFHVHRYETNFRVNFKVLDWDKLSGNDQVGETGFSLPELMASVPKPDPVTGIYPASVAEGQHDMTEYKLPIVTDKSVAWEFKHAPVLKFRAKYQPYRALRQQFWRQYLKQYDIDSNESISHLELTSMLDSLGSTLSRDTIDSFFSRFGVSPREGEISFEQAIQCLEEAVHMPNAQRKKVNMDDQIPDTVGTTPLANSPRNNFAVLPQLNEMDFSGPNARPANDESVMREAAMSLPGSQVTQEATNKPYIPSGTKAKDKLTVPTPPAIGRSPASGTSDQTLHGDITPTAPPITIANADQTLSAMSNLADSPGRALLEEMEEEEPSPSSSNASGSEDVTVVERVINIKTCPLCHRPRMNSKAETDIVTHLAVCASSDWARVDRMLVGNYVTPSQAQRKWYSKVITKVSSGAYELGANSANIIVQNRQTGQLEEEKMQGYVRLGIRLLYKGARSRMEGGRARKLLKSMSIKQGQKFDSPESAREILPFIAFHGLNVDEIRDPIESFKNFNQFFYRKLNMKYRPVTNPNDPRTLVSVADCRMMAFASVQEATSIWIKGREFTVARLLGDAYKDDAPRYVGGALGIFRLAPQDYHRFHVPVDGKIGKMTYISGEYYTVNPQAIRTTLDVYGENARKIVPIDSPQFGRVMAVCVGAMMVGTIVTTVEEGQQVKRGDEFGYFAFGGSTIVLLFEQGTVEWDEDLLVNGRASLETLVRVASGVGKAARGTAGGAS